eukprot:m.50460 g.50460  ORF g.50460 m.50460 type:complete len:191 (-) comp6228_c0_seq4:540-1112(-)
MEQVKAQATQAYAQFEKLVQDDKAVYFKYLQQLEDKTKVPKTKLVLGLLAVTVLLVLSSASFCNFASLLLGGVFPAYQSVLALQTNNADSQKRWLTYWVIFAVFLIPDFFFDIVSGIVSLYPQFKLFFILWCLWPTVPSAPEFLFAKVLTLAAPHTASTKPSVKLDAASINSVNDVKEQLTKANSIGSTQ